MVVEADESDGTFVKLPATIAVVTNIDPEHLDHYGTFEALREAFVTFVENIPFYGFAVLCIDHPEVQGILPRLLDRRIVTYGFSPQADVRGVDVRANGEGVRFDRDHHRPQDRREPHRRRSVPADVRPAQRAERAGRHRRRRRSRHRRRRDPPRPSPPSAASSAASPRPARSTASPSSTTTAITRSRSPPCWRPPRTVTRGQVIAVVQPHRYTRLREPVRGLLHLLQRRRRGDRRRRLSRRRGRRSRASTATRWSTGCARTAIATSMPLADRDAARRASSPSWRRPAISSSASAPATSPSGRTRCPASSPRCGAAGRAGARR